MVQYLKQEIQGQIVAAALEVFARQGYRGATMAGIGRAAGVSTGNIYRYYENKEVLFHAAITEEFTERLLGLVREKVESLAGVEDIGDLAGDAPFHAISAQLLGFCVENRLRIVVLLDKSQGTRYEGFAEEVIQRLSNLAIAHFRRIRPGLRVTEVMRFNLGQIYRNLLATTVCILSRFDGEAVILQAMAGYSRYHLAGLKALFDGSPVRPGGERGG
jgi:AcrR family transcriptional regulator